MRFGLNIPAGAVQSGTFAGTYLLTGTLQTGIANPRITITGAGINAYNAIGTNTFILSSADGSITINGGTITGGIIRTAATGPRIELTGTFSLQQSWYTGLASETTVSQLTSATGGSANHYQTLTISSASLNSHPLSSIQIASMSEDGITRPAQININTALVNITGTIALINTPSGTVTSTANSAAIAAVSTTLLTLSLTTGFTGGLYEIWYTCYGVSATVIGDLFQFTLLVGASAFTALQYKVVSIGGTATGAFLIGTVSLPASTANSITVNLIRSSGTGTMTVLATASVPMRLMAKAVIG